MIEVQVSKDGMMAALSVKPEPEETLTAEILENNLRLEGVQTGIDKEALAGILKDQTYDTFVPVAAGKAPVNGVDGYYEYFFSADADNGKPRIREDGSVDYARVIINVSEGDLLAEYHPETNGTFGYNVYAKALSPVKGKPARPLRCIHVRQDEKKYYAEKSGHVTLSNNTLAIQSVLEISGDATYNGGDIHFNGDIHVMGNINSNITVHAAGSVIVDGVIEDANVYAEQDIIVSQGIHGQGTHKEGVLLEEGSTTVEAKGSLQAKFIDHAFAQAGENIMMDYAIGSVIACDGKVTALGTKGTIVGGSTSAMLGVETGSAGNPSGLPTEIKVGYGRLFPEKLSAARERLAAIEEKMANYTGDVAPEYLHNMVDAAKKQLLELEQKSRDRQIAPIIVHNMIYPNVRMQFGKLYGPDMAGRRNVELRKIGSRILCKDIGFYTEKELSSGIIESSAQVVGTEKPNVLVIDDDARLLRTVHHILEESYQVAVATSGRTARKYLERNEADLILLDYMMPEENGVEVLNSLRAWDKTRDIPVVFLTGLDDKRKILECLSLNPAGYILKPVDSMSLLEKIHSILGEE